MNTPSKYQAEMAADKHTIRMVGFPIPVDCRRLDFLAGAYYADAEMERLRAEIAELKSCPNESWECAKEQRRLQAENEIIKTQRDIAIGSMEQVLKETIRKNIKHISMAVKYSLERIELLNHIDKNGGNVADKSIY